MIKKVFKHFKTICKHKYYVGKYCFNAGIPLRGILHDMSKFSPIEFIESAKYYQGNRSPIDACKEVNGISKAWMHHKGRNSHHYEYYQDNFDNGGEPVKMPFKDVCEMICDFLGAGHAYMGKNFNYKAEYDWWENKKSKPIAMHLHTKMFVDQVMTELLIYGKEAVNKDNLKSIYHACDIWYNVKKGE